MSRSSEFYKRIRESRNMKVLKYHEHITRNQEDFLDFNEFGPEVESEFDETKTMTLDEFVNLPVFSIENCQRAILALNNHEEITLEHDNDSVVMKSSDNETVEITYADITLTFSKHEIINSLQEIVDLSLNESIEIETEMPSVLKFKEFLEVEKKVALQNGKDNF